jgi:dTDP-4-amino-4,6-dideoxygalactose transaminase
MSTQASHVVPLLNVKAQNALLRTELLEGFTRVLDGGAYILGPEVEAFETELAQALGTRKAIGVTSGTDALLLSLMALGIGPGDEVVTTPFSFFATVGCIARLGARPVFSDIHPETFNLDAEKAASLCGVKTKAVIPVHLFGRIAELPRVGIPIVEDAAQAIGAGPLQGILSCLSFFPSKNLGGFGDGGAILCDDEGLAEKVLLLRSHGSRPKYVHLEVGGNFRLDAVHAALLRVKLPHLAKWSQARRKNADRYRQLFHAMTGIPSELRLPGDVSNHCYNQFVIRAPRRDELRKHLTTYGVGTEIYYPMPLHLQPCFRSLGYQSGAFPHAEAACREVLALPISPELTEDQQHYVVQTIASFYR